MADTAVTHVSCNCSSDGDNFCSGCYQTNSCRQDHYSYFNAHWHQQLWSYYSWWNNQHILYQRKNFQTWCSTCVEEHDQRKKREELKKGGERSDKGSFESLLSDHLYQNTTQTSIKSSAENNGVTSVSNRQYSDEHTSVDEESSSDDFEIELNDDFKKFLEQSAKHKRERSRLSH